MIIPPAQTCWEYIFGELGSQWLHTGRIFAALSDSSAEVVQEALVAAKKHGTMISYDLNYRPSLPDVYEYLKKS